MNTDGADQLKICEDCMAEWLVRSKRNGKKPVSQSGQSIYCKRMKANVPVDGCMMYRKYEVSK